MTDLSQQLDEAADPNTPLARLAELAYQYPAVRKVVAANPSTYDDLLVWLGQLGDPDIDAILLARRTAPESSVAPETTETNAATAGNVLSATFSRAVTPVRAWLARVPRVVTVTAAIALVAIVVTVIASVGTVSTAQGRLDAAITEHQQRQADADADADAEAEAEQQSEGPSEDPAAAPPAPPTVSADGHQIEWTETTSLGYSMTSTVTWGSVSRGDGDTVHPSSSSFGLGSGCGFEPTKDAYVAGVWRVTNSTENYGLALKSQMSVNGRISTPGVSVELEWVTSSGSNCGFSTLPYAASVESNSTMESGQSIASPIFIIIKNYYSPAFPDGAVGELANINVKQGFTGGVSAPLGSPSG